MLRWLRRVLAMSLCTLILLGAFEGPARASAVPRVSGVDVGSGNSCASGLKARWHKVAGASYQVRSAGSKAALRRATPVAVGRTKTRVPSFAGKSYVQVRAVRGSRVGAWSQVSVGRVAEASSRLAKPALSGYGLPGGVRFTWGCTKGATNYRVQWAAAPHGLWPTTTNYVSGWLPQGARSSTFGVPATAQSGDHMLNTAYANPVWGRLVARNRIGNKRLSVGWTPVFPAPPSPGAGDALRIGTYNVMLGPGPGARADALAANIAQHGLSVVAIQEATKTTAAAVVAALGPGWSFAVTSSQSQQILYRTDRYRVDASGTYPVTDWTNLSQPRITPWARLSPVSSASPGHGQAFYVTSVHFAVDTSKSALNQKHDNGVSAQEVAGQMASIDSSGLPVVVAGDLHNIREPFGDTPGYVEAQPTFVRSGYYDSMAALSKTGIEYSTFNGVSGTSGARQAPADSGVSSRTDYLMLKGFRGSSAYVNVVNWSSNGLVPSDHNLVYADLVVPFA